MARFSLSALGVDRPGIVAAVTEVLMGMGGNIEDSTMSILQGHFAILLVVSVPDDLDDAGLSRALDEVAARFDLLVSVRTLAEAPAASASDDPWVISVHGADRPGIVHGVTSALAAVGGNVVDLSTHLVGAGDSSVYVMMLRVTLPSSPDPHGAAQSVVRAADELGVHCIVHPDESDTL